MKLSLNNASSRYAFLALAILTTGACAGLDCDGNDDDHTPLLFRTYGIEPSFCHVDPGGEITLFLSSSDAIVSPVQSVSVGGKPAQILSSTSTTVTIKLAADTPAGASDIFVSGSSNQGGNIPFHVGPKTPTPEIEPNDAIDGSDATPMACSASGTLANDFDRDHFKRAVNPTGKYIITLEPPIVGIVFVNGTGVALNTPFTVPSGNMVVGLTGATGAYVLKVIRVE